MSASPLTVLYRWFLKLCIYFLHGLRMCTVSFFHIVNLVIPAPLPSIYRQFVPREHNSSYNFIPIFFKLCTCFLHSRKMCMPFWVIIALNFVTFFSTFWTLSFSDLRCIEMYRQWVPCDGNLIQFYIGLFETLHMLSPRSADVHVVWI